MIEQRALTQEKYLTPDEQALLEAALSRFRDNFLRKTTMLTMMLKGGLRPQEVLNLKWEDVDFNRKRLFVDTLKRGKPRYIPIGIDLNGRLLELSLRKDLHGQIFCMGYRNFVQFWNDFKPVKKKLHALRHTFAVNVYQKSGFDLKLVQQLLGHRNLTTTAVYLELEFNDEKAKNVLNQL